MNITTIVFLYDDDTVSPREMTKHKFKFLSNLSMGEIQCAFIDYIIEQDGEIPDPEKFCGFVKQHTFPKGCICEYLPEIDTINK